MEEMTNELKLKILYRIREVLRSISKRHGLDVGFSTDYIDDTSPCICDIWRNYIYHGNRHKANEYRTQPLNMFKSQFVELTTPILRTGERIHGKPYTGALPAWDNFKVRPRLMLITRLINKLEKDEQN